MRTEEIILNDERNVRMTAYLQEVGGEFRNISKRPAIVVLPGGGYKMCSDREADPVALSYLRAGYQAIVLRYSVGEYAGWPNQLTDYDEAVDMIRERAEDWNIDVSRIAVIGFSAGGHLAAMAASCARNRPAAAILGYPVITGECVSAYDSKAPDAAEAVNEDTCPCFIFATRTDNLVPVGNTIKFIEALNKQEIMYESHIYSYGNHGSSIGEYSVYTDESQTCNRLSHWVDDSVEWLKDVVGYYDMDGLQNHRLPIRLNGNREPVLNIDCTMGYIMSNEQGAKIVGGLLSGKSRESQGAEQQAVSIQEAMSMVKNMSVRSVLGFIGIAGKELEVIDEQLRQISNI